MPVAARVVGAKRYCHNADTPHCFVGGKSSGAHVRHLIFIALAGGSGYGPDPVMKFSPVTALKTLRSSPKSLSRVRPG